jgi:uncharacterized protein (UPF0262 family)
MLIADASKKGASVVVPAVVVAESLSGAASRDARTNAVLRRTTIIEIDEKLARSAADLRHRRRLRRGGTIDAIVMACADQERAVSRTAVFLSLVGTMSVFKSSRAASRDSHSATSIEAIDPVTSAVE